MNEDLRTLLLHAGADGGDRDQIERLAPHACCMPREPALQELVHALQARTGKHDPRPGETPLVAVTGTRASLWLLEPRAGQVEFIGAARAALELAEQLVTRDLPLLFDSSARPATFSARRLFTRGEQSLDGSSFGLSFCLAYASLMLDVALPADLVASAAVNANGELAAVHEAALSHKLELIRNFAPGVRTVLVARGNAAHAERVARELAARFSVVPASSLEAAFAVAFPDLLQALEARFDSTGKCEHAARRLFELVRDGSSSLLGWRGVAASSAWLVARLRAGSEAALEARFAEAVARRHAGEELACPFELAWVENMPRPLRLRVIAHIVEHSRFHEASERRAIRELAERSVAPLALDDATDDLVTLGALGRSYAAFREYEAASRCLARAIRGFRALGELEHSSFALSEWIRILGLTGRVEELRSLLSLEPPPSRDEPLRGAAHELLASPRAAAVSRAFVRFALGRAFVQAEAPLEGLRFLEDSPEQNWSLTLSHLQASRLRWFARALRATGARGRAEQAARALASLAATTPEAKFARALAEMDAALEADADPSQALAELRQLEPLAVGHIEAETPSAEPLDLARAVARYYPY